MNKKMHLRFFLPILLSLLLIVPISVTLRSDYAYADSEPSFGCIKLPGSQEIIEPENIQEGSCFLIKVPSGTSKVNCYLSEDTDTISALSEGREYPEEIDITEDMQDGWYEIDLSSGRFDLDDHWFFNDIYDCEYISEFDPSSNYYAFQSGNSEWVIIQVEGESDLLPVYLTKPDKTIDIVLEYDEPIVRSFKTGKNLTLIESDQIVYYTTDGSDPKDSQTAVQVDQGTDITINNDTIFKARTHAGNAWGELCVIKVSIRPVAPQISLKSGNYMGEQSVELDCGTSGSKIYYTTDGSDPDDSSLLYNNEPILISTDTVLKAVAYKGDMSPSEIVAAEYHFKGGLLLDLKDEGKASWALKESFASSHGVGVYTKYGIDKCDLIATIPEGATITVNGQPVEKNSDGEYEFCLDAIQVISIMDDQNSAKNEILIQDGDITVPYFVYCVQACCDGLPDRIIDYFCVGSQYTNQYGGFGGNVENTLLGAAATRNCTSMGNFGGYATWWYEDGIENDPNNPYGVDFVVIGNSFDGTSEAAEPGNVLVSEDGETWYTLAGSIHYDANAKWNQKVTYRKSETASGMTDYELDGSNMVTWDTYSYPRKVNYPWHKNQDGDFSEFITYGTFLIPEGDLNEYGNTVPSYPAFGYADVGYCNSYSNEAENPYGGLFKGGMVGHDYTWRTLTNRNGDGFDLDWAVDKDGKPKKLQKIHYVKIQTATGIVNDAIGEKSTEICCIRKAKPADSSVGITDAPTSIEFDGTVISGSDLTSGTISEVNVDGIFDVKVNAKDGSNVYINSIKDNVAYFDKAPHGIVRIIVQEGEKAPVIYYFNIKQSEQPDSKKVTKIVFDANDGMMFDKEKYIAYYDADTLEHCGGNDNTIKFDDPIPQRNSLAFYNWYDAKNDKESYMQIDTDFLDKYEEVTLSAKYAKTEDVTAAKAVTEAIMALKDKEELSEEDAEPIAAAREAYDGLSNTQKDLVGEKVYNKLLEAEEVVGALDAYRLINEIDKLPSVDELELADEEQIQAAVNAYNKLSEDLKKKVSNYSKLLEDMLKISELKMTNVEQALKQAKTDLQTAQNRVTELEGTVSTLQGRLKDAQDAVTEAQNKYDDLKAESDADKAELTQAKTDLANAKAAEQEAKEKLEKAQTDLTEAQGNVTKLEGKVSSLEKDLADEKAKAEAAQGDADKYEEELAKLKAQNAILKKTVKKVKAKAKKKSALVSWKSVGKGFTYEVYRSTNPTKSFKKVKTAKKLKVTVKKLRKGKTYYFKVRAFKKVGGKKVYTGYSNIAKVKIKK